VPYSSEAVIKNKKMKSVLYDELAPITKALIPEGYHE
jgi:hypothetical protein